MYLCIYVSMYLCVYVSRLRRSQATPGRLNDLLTKKRMTMAQCCYLCMDEAELGRNPKTLKPENPKTLKP